MRQRSVETAVLSIVQAALYTSFRMAIIEKYPAGAFCWIELATTHQTSAKNFYSSLFNWTMDDSPIGPDDLYTIFKLQGRDAAAAYTMRKEQRAQGVPPNWLLYISVENAEETVAKVVKAGGVVHMPAFDVMEAGRMAVLQDPTGAVFAIWQPKNTKGLGIGAVDNTFCWADLSTPAPEKATRFYSTVFGWEFSAGAKDHSGYLHIKNGEAFIGGVPPARLNSGNVPPHWLVYFRVADVAASAAKAAQMGATIHMGPQTMEGVGTMAVIADPQGAVFALFKSARP